MIRHNSHRKRNEEEAKVLRSQDQKKQVRRQKVNDDETGHSKLKAKIEEWLEAEGISYTNVADFNSHFHIQVNLKNVCIHIQESKVRRGVLVVQGVLSPSELQLDKLEQVKPEDKRSLFLSLFAILDKSEYLFMLQEDFSSKSWLRIHRTLYVEDLTRSSLLNEMKDLNTKFVNMNYALNEALGSLVPVSKDLPIYS